MTKTISARLAFDVKRKATKERKALVQIVITYQRKRHYFSTGIHLFKDQWNDKTHVVNCINSVEYNDILNALMRKINDYIRQCHEKNDPFIIEHVERMLSVGIKNEISFLDFVHDRVNNRPDIGEGTRNHHRVMADALTEFGKIQYVSDVTKANILDFHDFIQKKGIMQTTVYNYMKNLKVYVNQAIERGLIAKDPFQGIRLDRGKNALREFLTEEELQRLKKVEIKIEPVIKARDLFLFQAYTGMAYADMMRFDYDKDVTERAWKKIITSKRVKSDEDFYIVLLKPALDVLRKYDYKLPKMSNQKYNEFLKVAVAFAKIDKNITSHSGRHTFAVTALNNGISMEVVSKILGHADIKTTKIYAKILNKSVEDAFAKLEKIV